MKKALTTTEISNACLSMTFEQANNFIEKSSGLKLKLIRNMSCERLWRVQGNKEICYISNCYKSLVTGKSEVKFVFN